MAHSCATSGACGRRRSPATRLRFGRGPDPAKRYGPNYALTEILALFDEIWRVDPLAVKWNRYVKIIL